MSFPLVLIFERHWDRTPQLMIKNLLPELDTEGYDTFCCEDSFTNEKDHLADLKEEVERGANGIQGFHSFVGENKFSFQNGFNEYTVQELQAALPQNLNPSLSCQIAGAAKTFSAIKLGLDNLLFAKSRSFSIVSIDDPSSLQAISSANQNQNPYLELARVLGTKTRRDHVMADHLFQLHANHKGAVAPIGASHFTGIVNRLKEKGLSDKDIVCLYPHTSYSYDKNVDDTKRMLECGEIFSDKTTCATTSEEIDQLAQILLIEIKSKITQNCHIKFLNKHFNVDFKPSIRPGFHLDARLPIAKVTDQIKQDLDDLGIQHETDQNYFVIPDVNTTEIANNIRLLPHKV